MVNKSANTATSKINCPIVVRIMFISLRVGTTTPNEIVEMIITIKRTSLTNPNHLNAKAKTTEIIIINANTVSASLR
ncbi:hypothetical protein Q604_UNBC18544G0009 [human gut metagenome]|uniref:Uncharacterized protein n=1 Tax=human gut metagenome TaxID=408170 RepID=W1WMN4_9ZZZZ